MKSMPWQDIYPLENWKTFLSRYESREMSSKSTKGLNRLLKRHHINKLLTRLSDHIEHYHGLKKRSIKNLIGRAGVLQTIALTGKEFLQKYNIGEKASLTKGSSDYKDARKKSLDYAVTKLVRRATRKAEYIRELKKHVEDNSFGFRPLGKDRLIAHLARKRVQDDVYVELVKDVLLEKLDPWHRPFEAVVGGKLKTDNIFNLAFGLWQNAPTRLPLFVWLEGHYTCTGVFADDPSGRETKYRVEVQDIMDPRGHISYSPAHGVIYWSLFANGMIQTAPMPDDLGFKKLNTRGFIGKPDSDSPGMLAYVWTKDETLLTARHEGGNFHHSSFTAGDKVKCSGMIRARDGKVTKVNSDSGHYQPRTVHLKNFVTFLNHLQVFDPKAKVDDRDPASPFNKPVGVNVFLVGTQI